MLNMLYVCYKTKKFCYEQDLSKRRLSGEGIYYYEVLGLQKGIYTFYIKTTKNINDILPTIVCPISPKPKSKTGLYWQPQSNSDCGLGLGNWTFDFSIDF